jgi:kynurenine formamidase
MIPGYRVVDLSLPLAEDLPCSWPGNIPYQHKAFTYYSAGFHTRWLMFAEHTGTHFDAPSHWVPPPDSGLPGAGPAGAISTDGVPLEQLIGPAVVIDLTQSLPAAEPGHSPAIDVGALEAFEAEHGRIEPGEVVILRTDWDRRYVSGDEGRHYISECVAGREPGWPAPTAAAVTLLVERGIRCLATDTPSVGAVEEGYSAHVAGLAHGLVYVEGLTGLAELPVRGGIFVFLPIPVRDGTGAPGRAVCLLPDGGAM